MEAPQPQVAAVDDGKAHQTLGLEPAEFAATEDGQSARASVSTPAPSAPALDVATMSTQMVGEEETVPVTGPSTQLRTYSPEFAGLMKSWSGLLNQASVFDGQLRVSPILCCFLRVDVF